MKAPGTTAIGTWSGGRFMRFGEAIDADRYAALLRPGDGIETVITADVYGMGAADRALGEALAGVDRDSYSLAGAIGHDFYTGERDGAKGFPRFTNPRLRGPEEYEGYLRMAAERSLERVGADRFDLLMLHNPDRTGYSSETVWDAMAALREVGLTDRIGVAPGPANGFTLDLIDCVERFGDRIDWAMIILNPLEPWPGELCLEAAEQNGVGVIARVVDYGGLFWGDLRPDAPLARGDHRSFRPDGWIAEGVERIERMRSIADRHGLTPLQLACQWTLAHPAVSCVAPTIVQEAGPQARSAEEKRAELATLPAVQLSDEEVAEIREIGDNKGCMPLKGGSPVHRGDDLADGWSLNEELLEVGRRWGIDPAIDLVEATAA
ncbi:MAG: aldo/keto reductase [Solirubrobacterales bacterium]